MFDLLLTQSFLLEVRRRPPSFLIVHFRAVPGVVLLVGDTVNIEVRRVQVLSRQVRLEFLAIHRMMRVSVNESLLGGSFRYIVDHYIWDREVVLSLLLVFNLGVLVFLLRVSLRVKICVFDCDLPAKVAIFSFMRF